MTGTRPLSAVTELSHYGQHITGVTPEGRRRMPGILFRAAKRKFGLVRAVWFLVVSAWRGRGEVRKHPAARELARGYSRESARDFSFLAGMYITLTRWEDADTAYDFLRSAVQETAPYQMAELYEVSELKQFEDPFAAFAAYNKAMFADDPNYPVREIFGDDNELHIHLSACANCTIAEAFGHPRLAQLGCDHDLVGYPSIEDEVGAVFRRPQTLAKGGEFCEFSFYRKGFEPAGPYENK